MRKSFFVSIIFLLFMVSVVFAVVPRIWELRNQDEFLKGKFDGISVSEDGHLSLSPKEVNLETPPEEFLLSYIQSPEGVAYLGTGHSGKIYKISSTGKLELFFKVPEMDVYCLALDRKGRLYAGTSPNGRIYKITAKDKGSTFFDPTEKYIWDLLLTEKESLLVAVGETGGIYEVNQEGVGRSILKAEQNHILSLMRDKDGSFLAGSGGRGLLYRIAAGRKASILFESPYEEINSIALDDQGNIFVAASGVVTTPKKDVVTPVPVKREADVTLTVTPSQTETRKAPVLTKDQPSAVYRVSSEGVTKRIWHSRQDLIYTLIWDDVGKRMIFGTGAKGRIYALGREGKFSLILQKNSEQVSSLVLVNSKIYVLANNPASLSVIHPDQTERGEYLSRIFDTQTISSWGRIEWDAEVPTGSSLQFLTRSGNSDEPDQSWAEWSPPYQKQEGEQILSPKARYIQFKTIFQTQSGKVSPLLQRVNLFYLQANLEPVITKLDLLPPNEVYLKPPAQEDIIWGVETAARPEEKEKNQEKILMLAKKVKRKGFQTFVWEASDENGDDLLFTLYIKREDDRQWRTLKENWKETIFAFDTLSFPDGVYSIKVEASDIPSNPLGMERKSEKTTSPLVIDNSLPVIKNFQATKQGNRLKVVFTAEDSMSSLEKVHYTIRPDGWRNIFPLDGICDSKQENFDASLSLPAQADNFITLKVIDRHGNIGVYRYPF